MTQQVGGGDGFRRRHTSIVDTVILWWRNSNAHNLGRMNAWNPSRLVPTLNLQLQLPD